MQPPKRRGLCLVVAAPSGAGKSTITRAMLESDPNLQLSVSVTTRNPRRGEQEGVHYYYIGDAAFAQMAESGALLEWATVFGRGYGTPRAPVEAALQQGIDLLFDIDWQGWRQLKSAMPQDVVGVFVLPPSLAALRARLVARAGEDADEISKRMAAAAGEIAHWQEFDHIVVNDDLATCITQVKAVLEAARTVTARCAGLGRLANELIAGGSQQQNRAFFEK